MEIMIEENWGRGEKKEVTLTVHEKIPTAQPYSNLNTCIFNDTLLYWVKGITKYEEAMSNPFKRLHRALRIKFRGGVNHPYASSDPDADVQTALEAFPPFLRDYFYRAAYIAAFGKGYRHCTRIGLEDRRFMARFEGYPVTIRPAGPWLAARTSLTRRKEVKDE